ncbi:hypothetical protein ACFLZW_02265 [Chloroflexota bacterium]
MKLTRRQKEFITNLIDLSDEFEGPIHYSLLAERLGVSPFTAYDMLRVLEEKGLVISEYHLPADKGGPGRAERLFYPNRPAQEPAKEMFERFGGRRPGKEELKQIILSGVELGEIWNKDLAAEILARVPDIEEGKLSFCVEIMTIVALRMKPRAGRRLLLDHLPALLPPGEAAPENLSLLGGFAFGILVQECAGDDEWIQKLFVYIKQYIDIVLSLTPGECRRLVGNLTDVFGKMTVKTDD